MPKHQAIESAEYFRRQAEKSTDPINRSMYFDLAARYYREAEQHNLMIWCRQKGANETIC